MTRIAILGGTGYAGSNIAAEAVSRGLEVTSWSRKQPAADAAVEGVAYHTGDLTDTAVLAKAIENTDVLITALSPRGELDGKLVSVYKEAFGLAEKAGVRVGVVGGAGSLLIAEGGPTVASTPDFPDEFKSEAAQLAEVLEVLRAHEGDLDWFYISPAGGFGGYAPGEKKGTFRVGGDVLLVDEEGNSFISGADFATAVINEVEKPEHSRTRFTVAY